MTRPKVTWEDFVRCVYCKSPINQDNPLGNIYKQKVGDHFAAISKTKIPMCCRDMFMDLDELHPGEFQYAWAMPLNYPLTPQTAWQLPNVTPQ